MLSEYFVDLHVHTVLSPCGELEMGAPEIISRVIDQGIHLIAITDHNECSNVRAIQDAAGPEGPAVLSGIEVQTAEDIHVVLIFPELSAAEKYQTWLRKGFRNVLNRPEVFGYQLIIDRFNNILDEVDTLLVQGVSYSIEEVLDKSKRHNAISILAHIDRPSFSFPAVLGPIPFEFNVDALELSSNITAQEAVKIKNAYPYRSIIRSSDSHKLETISRANCTSMLLDCPTFNEIAMALRHENGRKIIWPW